MLAVLTGNLHIASLLLEAKANVELTNVLSQTAFGSAFAKKHTELVYLLFSVMSQQQLENEIRIQPEVETEYQKFKAAVVQHQMDGFKKLGPLLLDKNDLNPFNQLPFEIKEFIIVSPQAQKKKKNNILNNFIDNTLSPLMNNLQIKSKK